MIQAYSMMDERCKLPDHYLKADLWWRCPEWIAAVPHVCVRQVAAPIPYRNHVSAAYYDDVDRATARSDRDGLTVMGELTTEKLKITGIKLWSGGPDFLSITSISELHKMPPARVLLDLPFIRWEHQQAPFHFAGVANHRGKVIIINGGKDAQQAYRWLAPEEMVDEPAVKSQLELPRERRTALIMRNEVVLDERKQKAVPIGLDFHKAIVIDPAMINFMTAEPYPVYVREFFVTNAGLHQFRPPTVDVMLRQIKHHYFTEHELDEMVPQKALANALINTMREVDKHTHILEVHLTLRELASMVLFEQFELEGTELYTNISHLEEDEQHTILERLFGKRIFRIVGPRNRVYVACDCH